MIRKYTPLVLCAMFIGVALAKDIKVDVKLEFKQQSMSQLLPLPQKYKEAAKVMSQQVDKYLRDCKTGITEANTKIIGELDNSVMKYEDYLEDSLDNQEANKNRFSQAINAFKLAILEVELNHDIKEEKLHEIGHLVDDLKDALSDKTSLNHQVKLDNIHVDIEVPESQGFLWRNPTKSQFNVRFEQKDFCEVHITNKKLEKSGSYFKLNANSKRVMWTTGDSYLLNKGTKLMYDKTPEIKYEYSSTKPYLATAGYSGAFSDNPADNIKDIIYLDRCELSIYDNGTFLILGLTYSQQGLLI